MSFKIGWVRKTVFDGKLALGYNGHEIKEGHVPETTIETTLLRIATYNKPVPMLWKQMAALRVEFPGNSVAELAKTLGVNYNTVWMTTKKTEYQHYENWVLEKKFDSLPANIRATAEEVKEKFQTYMGDMQDRLLSIIETTPDEKLQAQIAHDWLDRAGHMPRNKDSGRVTTLVVTPEVMEMLSRRAVEAGLIEGETVEEAS